MRCPWVSVNAPLHQLDEFKVRSIISHSSPWYQRSLYLLATHSIPATGNATQAHRSRIPVALNQALAGRARSAAFERPVRATPGVLVCDSSIATGRNRVTGLPH